MADEFRRGPLAAVLTPARCLRLALGVCLLALAAILIYHLGAVGRGPAIGNDRPPGPDVWPRRGATAEHQQPQRPPLAGRAIEVRVQAELNRPAYVYLVWIDSRGQALPVYPWTKGRWSDRPARQFPVERLHCRTRRTSVLEHATGHTGMETLVLLAGETPLPEDIDLPRLFAGLSAQPVEDPQALLVFDGGKAVRAEGSGNPSAEKRPPRGPNLAQPAKNQTILLCGLRPSWPTPQSVLHGESRPELRLREQEPIETMRHGMRFGLWALGAVALRRDRGVGRRRAGPPRRPSR